ncbi:hypothetical protein P7C70_g2010, partial [Phenoliferia sp. Uapishka_3]
MSSLASTLPAEIIKHILELAVEESATFDNGDVQANLRSGYAVLRKAARVSKAWSVPACEALWRRVELRTGTQAHKFALSAGNRRYRTKEVLVDCTAGPSSMKMLAELEGVQSLEIGPNVKGISSDFMYLPSLKEVTSLKIRCMIVESYRRSSSPEIKPIPLRLKHLTISGECTSKRTIAAILLGVQDSLVSLDLQGLLRNFPKAPSNFKSLPNLLSIKFNEYATSFVSGLLLHTPDLQQSFAFDAIDTTAFRTLFSKSVKTPLYSLELSRSQILASVLTAYVDPDENRETVEWALREFDVLRELKVLRVWWTREALGKTDSGLTLLETIESRGIKLEGLSDRELNP